MVWGGITWAIRTQLVTVIGNLNAVQDRDDILDQYVLPFINANAPLTLQQDNARPHVARIVTDHLQANAIDVLDWLAISPDLSPIDHVWDEMEKRLRREPKQPQKFNELDQTLQRIWMHFHNNSSSDLFSP